MQITSMAAQDGIICTKLYVTTQTGTDVFLRIVCISVNCANCT